MDISASRQGPQKTALIFSYLQRFPLLHALLYTLIDWARSISLIKHTGEPGSSLLNTLALCRLCIEYLCKEGAIEQMPIPDHALPTVESITSFFDKNHPYSNTPTTSHAPQEVLFANGWDAGAALISFYQHFSRRNIGPIVLRDPIRPECMAVDLHAQGLATFVEECHFAYHLLARTRSVEALLVAKRKKVIKKLTRLMSERFRESEKFFTQKVERASGAKLRVFGKEEGEGEGGVAPLLLLEITGSAQEVLQAEAKLKEVCSNVKNTVDKYRRGRCDRCFVEGSLILLFEGSWMETDWVGFRQYHGPHHPHHKEKLLHEPVLLSPIEVDYHWRDHIKQRFKQACY